MEETRLSKVDTYCFLMNAIVGAGIYTIPHAFQSAGILISLVLLVIIAIVSWLVHIELLAITEKLTKSPYTDINVDLNQLVPGTNYQLTAHHWDLPAIIQALFKRYPYVVYAIFAWFAVCIIALLTAYVNLFGTAFGTLFDCEYTSGLLTGNECEWKYRIGTMVFTVALLFLTVVEYKELRWLQYIMIIMQFTMLAFLILYSIKYGSTEHLSSKNEQPFNYSEICNTFSILAFAYLYHVCIPGVLAAGRGQHREQKEVALWMFISVAILYGLTGVISSLFFKELPADFGPFFQKHLSAEKDQEAIPSLFWLFAHISIYLPALDVICNSGIYGQSLAGMFVTFFYGTNHELAMQNHRFECKLIRVLCVLPAPIFAQFSMQLVSFT